MIIYVFIVLF